MFLQACRASIVTCKPFCCMSSSVHAWPGRQGIDSDSKETGLIKPELVPLARACRILCGPGPSWELRGSVCLWWVVATTPDLGV